MMDFLPTLAASLKRSYPPRRLTVAIYGHCCQGLVTLSRLTMSSFTSGAEAGGIRHGSMKLHFSVVETPSAKGKNEDRTASQPRLYDLSKDIGESNDLAPAMPGEVARLTELAQRMAGDLDLDGVGPGCRPLGRVAAPKSWIER